MASILIEKPSKHKLFKDKAIGVGAFLGGPLVIGYFFAENFKAVNQSEKVKTTWIITIISTIAIFSIVFMIPENSNFPNQLIPISYTLIAYYLYKQYQEEHVLKKIESSGEYHGWGRIIGVSIIGLMITLSLVLIGVFAILGIEEADLTTKQYGLTVKHEIEYDSTNLTEAEVDLIADAFIEHAFFDLDDQKYVYVVKEGNMYELYIPIYEFYANDSATINELSMLQEKIDAYIKDNPVTIKLVVDSIDNVVKVFD